MNNHRNRSVLRLSSDSLDVPVLVCFYQVQKDTAGQGRITKLLRAYGNPRVNFFCKKSLSLFYMQSSEQGPEAGTEAGASPPLLLFNLAHNYNSKVNNDCKFEETVKACSDRL